VGCTKFLKNFLKKMQKQIKKHLVLVLVFLFLNIIAIFFVLYLLRARVPFIAFMGKPFVPANIVVNTNTQLGPVNQSWKALAQGGEEPGLAMLSPTINYLKRIRPEYIRLDHIFDDQFYQLVQGRSSSGSLQLDFSRLDATVADIQAVGAKPFFSLSYMPSLLAENLTDVPYSWSDWQDLVRQTVAHYSGKISDVYYEVWNEPSLPNFGRWRMYGNKDYRLLYEYAVLGAKQANPQYSYKIGGPAIPEMDTQWVSLLMDYCLEKDLRLDFISWHRYSLEPDIFAQDVEDLNQLFAGFRYQQFAGVEKIVSEWGPSADKHKVYASHIAVSHSAAVIRKMLDEVKFIFTFEIKDGPGQADLGWGLLSHESVGIREKPRFYLYEWLADFNGQRLELLGEGSQTVGFASKNKDMVSVLLTNYSYSRQQKESFQLTFSQLDGGQYRLRAQELFKRPEEKQANISQPSLVLNLELPAYSVIRVDLIKISDEKSNSQSGFGKLFFDGATGRF
jgi:hypothetical protein